MITVTFKSIPSNYDKEKDGRKPNTVREYDEGDVRFSKEPTHIIIKKRGTKQLFIRKLTDVTRWGNLMIYSWRHE